MNEKIEIAFFWVWMLFGLAIAAVAEYSEYFAEVSR